jgi:GT2 family glycosyltransferase/glycosyltransferase involved in cell wall biosynthesis
MPPEADGSRPEPDRAELESDELRRALDRERAIARREARQAERELGEARAELKATRQQLVGLSRRRSVRFSVAIVDRGRAALKRFESIARRIDPRAALSERSEQHAWVASQADQDAFLARLRARPTPAARTSGPLVSIVMLNHDGAAHLRRCLPALAATAYRDLELIVVDNGSRDDSVSILNAFSPAFPVRIVRNSDNASFSDGNNQGVAESRGELLLFLNNDVEPIDVGWLGHLIETLLQPATIAVGARLIYPPRGSAPRAGLRFPDLSLQHGGVEFRMEDGVPFPVAMGAGGDPLGDWASAVREVPALTAACLLVRRADFDAVGGFTPGYQYGQEDIDLCLKLRSRGGRFVYDGRAALWHHESATRDLGDRAANRERVRSNRDRFVGTWAPRLYRTVMLDASRGGVAWRDEPLHIGIDADPAGQDPGETFESPAWRVNRLNPADDIDPTIDVFVALDGARDIRRLPAGMVRIAWIRGAIEDWLGRPWIDDYDIVAIDDPAAMEAVERGSGQRAQLIAGPSAEALAQSLESWLVATRIGIQIAVPSWDVAPSWGDLHVARGLQRALRRLDHPSRIHIRPDATGWPAARDDLIIHLVGLAGAPSRPGRLDVLWHISHPDRASVELYERYDHVFVGSDGFARWMQTQVRVPVSPLHQATDPERFRPEPGGPSHELLLVANSRGTQRHILDDLLPTTHNLAVYGRGWTEERLDPRFVAGEAIPNDELGGYYAAAAIVLNDHWTDMQREGFLSNRLYDASAAGGFVISDDIDGLEAEFDGGVVAYRDRKDLGRLIDHYLRHPEERRAMADRARAAVLARHTFDHRARELLERLEPLLAQRPRSI